MAKKHVWMYRTDYEGVVPGWVDIGEVYSHTTPLTRLGWSRAVCPRPGAQFGWLHDYTRWIVLVESEGPPS